jgi:hypothetical protein
MAQIPSSRLGQEPGNGQRFFRNSSWEKLTGIASHNQANPEKRKINEPRVNVGIFRS